VARRCRFIGSVAVFAGIPGAEKVKTTSLLGGTHCLPGPKPIATTCLGSMLVGSRSCFVPYPSRANDGFRLSDQNMARPFRMVAAAASFGHDLDVTSERGNKTH
jgi:hypothetical protein